MALDRYQAKLNRGYAKVATKLGRSAEFYRPVDATNPLDVANSSGSQMVRVDPDGDFRTERVALYGKPVAFAAFDREDTLVGDYFVFEDGQTYFIAAQQDLTPTAVVKCNRTATITRPGQASERRGYEGRAAGPILSDWPVSMLEGTKGEKGLRGLPDESRRPWFDVLMPYFAGVTIKTNDILTDDLGNDHEVSSAELTDLGYRLTVGFTGVSA